MDHCGNIPSIWKFPCLVSNIYHIIFKVKNWPSVFRLLCQTSSVQSTWTTCKYLVLERTAPSRPLPSVSKIFWECRRSVLAKSLIICRYKPGMVPGRELLQCRQCAGRALWGAILGRVGVFKLLLFVPIALMWDGDLIAVISRWIRVGTRKFRWFTSLKGTTVIGTAHSGLRSSRRTITTRSSQLLMCWTKWPLSGLVWNMRVSGGYFPLCWPFREFPFFSITKIQCAMPDTLLLLGIRNVLSQFSTQPALSDLGLISHLTSKLFTGRFPRSNILVCSLTSF